MNPLLIIVIRIAYLSYLKVYSGLSEAEALTLDFNLEMFKFIAGRDFTDSDYEILPIIKGNYLHKRPVGKREEFSIVIDNIVYFSSFSMKELDITVKAIVKARINNYPSFEESLKGMYAN